MYIYSYRINNLNFRGINVIEQLLLLILNENSEYSFKTSLVDKLFFTFTKYNFFNSI